MTILQYVELSQDGTNVTFYLIKSVFLFLVKENV